MAPKLKVIKALTWGVIGTNVYVFGKWHFVVPPKAPDGRPLDANHPAVLAARKSHVRYMNDHYTLSQRNIDEGRYWTVLTSAFSHQQPLHLFFNMFMLRQATSIATLIGLGPARVAALAVSSALGGSAAYLYEKSTRGGEMARRESALGASGMVQGMLVATAFVVPRLPMHVFLIPIPIAYRTFVGGFLAWDLYQYYDQRSDPSLRKTNWMGSSVAYAGHFGGAVAGAVFYLLAIRRGRVL